MLSYESLAELGRIHGRTEEEWFLHQGTTPALCSWACLPKAVESGFSL